MNDISPNVVIDVVNGNLLDQVDADVWVNPWNRNFVPRFLLVPHGVSGALKKVTGSLPWRELASYGLMDTGEAVLTSGGELKQSLIHVAGINAFWVSGEGIIRKSVVSAVSMAWENGFSYVAMPLIGAGVGGGNGVDVLGWIEDELSQFVGGVDSGGSRVMRVSLVVYKS